MRFMIFDTETTGLPLHPKAKMDLQPRIIELALLIVDDECSEISSYTQLFNPERKLEAVITKITGLSDDYLTDEPTFAEAFDDTLAAMRDIDGIVAHNLPFDSTMLWLEFERLGVPLVLPPRRICTVQEHFEEWGFRPNLKQLYKHYTGRSLEQTHRALDDLRALNEICLLSGVLKGGVA